MKLEDFNAGEWKQQYQYKRFAPEFVNKEWTWDGPSTNMLLAEANRALGELNVFSLIVPDIKVDAGLLRCVGGYRYISMKTPLYRHSRDGGNLSFAIGSIDAR